MSGKLFKLISTRKSTEPLGPTHKNALNPQNQEDISAAIHTYAKDLCLCSERSARDLIPYSVAQKLGVLPLALIDLGSRELLNVASFNDAEQELAASLKFLTNKEVRITHCAKEVVELAVFMAYQGDEFALKNKLSLISQQDQGGKSSWIQGSNLEFRRSEGAAGILSALTDFAISQQASDLHFIPMSDGCHVSIRIHGELRSHQQAICSAHMHAQLIARLKVLARLDTTQRQVAQDGSFRVPVQERFVDIRVGIMPTIHGEKAVLRFFGLQQVLALEALGFSAECLDMLETFLIKQEGALLVSGPTGSGKSSTLYALVHELSKRNLSCVTIEDPVELQIAGVAQTSVNSKAGNDYADCLRAVLRQDPDCILLGEMRDKASAEIALQAAITGHLLLSTLHARSVHEIILRLRHFKLDPLTIAQALGLLINQRLLPRLCAKCKVIDLAASQSSGFTVYQEVGCAECCYSAYSGQVLVYEMLQIDAALADKLAKGRIPGRAKSAGTRPGYYPLTTCLEKQLAAGMISARQFQTLIQSL